MINLSTFNQRNGKVQHSLTNNWTWDKIDQFRMQQISKNPLYYRDLGSGGYTVGGVGDDSYVASILNFLQPLAPTFYARAGIYVSKDATSKSFPLHTDPGQHLWVWQVIGSTPWQVGEEYLTLNENEVLYILPGVPHRTIPNAPRASITLSLEEFI